MAGSPLAPPRRQGGQGMARLCARCLRGGARLTVVLALLLLLALGLGLARLAQGPVALPALAEAVERQVNARLDGARLSIGAAELDMGTGGDHSGLEFRDVRVRDAAGAPLLAAPRLAARFALSDLLVGRVRPVSLTLDAPEMAVLRARDGRIRAGFGPAGMVLGGGDGAESGPGMDAVARILDGLVGDAEPVPVMARLEQVLVRDATIRVRDATTGHAWRAEHVRLRVWRTAGGARALMRGELNEGGPGEARLAAAAERRRGTGRTEVQVNLRELPAAALAGALGARTEGLAGALRGRVGFTVGPRGGISGLSGRLVAHDATLPGVPGRLGRLDRLDLALGWAPERERLRITALEAEGPGLSARLSGHLEAAEDAALTGRLEVAQLSIDAPSLFPGPIAFDGGRLDARVALAPLALDIREARLTAGAMALSAAGRLMPGDAGPEGLLTFAAREVTVPALKRHWPIGTGGNARPWVVENLVGGRVPRLDGSLRLGAGPPELRLGFAFEGVASRYLGDMPPIEGGRGTAQLTLDRFDLALEAGEVTPSEGGAPIRLDGSHLAFTGLLADVTPADITVRGTGPTEAVLALIDRQPLGLVSRLGLGLGPVAGEAEVTARLGFPLDADLEIEEVAVDARATLTGTRLALPLGEARPEVSADRLTLSATTEEMTLSGRAALAGRGFDIAWTERYGAGPGGSELTAIGTVDPGVLRALGAPETPFTSGTAEARLSVSSAGGPTRIGLEADLSGAALVVPELRWQKQPGAPGRLTATAEAEGGRITLDPVSVETAGLAAEGRAVLDEGRLSEGRLDRFVLDGRADLSARIGRGPGGALDIALDGRWLDLSGVVERPPEGGTGRGPPLAVAARIDRLRLTPTILIEPAEARFDRGAEGRLTADLSGTAGRGGHFSASYTRAPGEPGRIALESPDAGALLGGLGFFGGARGGALTLSATLGAPGGPDIEGKAKIREMTVQGATTFGDILAEGGIDDAAAAVEEGGLTFDSIRIPFTRSDGVIGIERAVARSPLLAVTAEGRVDEAEERLDLRGVISPAYAVTGALDEIPLLGALLTGGEGEGILAMTFSVTGTLADPVFTVNPLSLLAPGILRSVFSGSGKPPSDRFLEQLGRDD